MRTAIFSDIHANREALDSCLADARRRGAERFVFLGDLVGYGADPAYVVDVVAGMRDDGAIVIKGNHDAAVADSFVRMNQYARAAMDWTRERLSMAQKSFLADLPLSASCGDVLFVHSEAFRPEQWIYVTQTFEAERSMLASALRITVSGHVHRPTLYRMSGPGRTESVVPVSDAPIFLTENEKWHAVIGSVGQPRDENPAAAYALYDDCSSAFIFVRKNYDIEAAARKIKAAGLPALLSERLYVGR